MHSVVLTGLQSTELRSLLLAAWNEADQDEKAEFDAKHQVRHHTSQLPVLQLSTESVHHWDNVVARAGSMLQFMLSCH